MRQFSGMSRRGDVAEAVQGMRNPDFLMLMSMDAEQFEAQAAQLEKLFPGVPSIGCVSRGYNTRVAESGVTVVAFQGDIKASTAVLEEVSTMPAKYIQRLEKALQEAGGSGKDTVCIDFCAGNDACVLSTLQTALKKKGIPLVGGTGDAGKVSANGKVYTDAAACGIVHNLHGRVKTYKENIYHQLGDYRFVASNTDRGRYIIGSLNGRPAKQVYKEILQISDKQILTQTLKNPFGKLNGDDICIISIKDVEGNSLACYRQVNDSDVLVLMELGDFQSTVNETIQRIISDFPKRSAVFSVNCLFRYNLFNDYRYMPAYLRQMSALGDHAGFVGYGEHHGDNFVNQSMTCVVFE